MDNYDSVIEVIDGTKNNVKKLKESKFHGKINQCISFSHDLKEWVTCIEELKNNTLIYESCEECVKSLLFCMLGFYKEAIVALRQFMEHLLFAILLSTSDYRYRMWKSGNLDMSWQEIINPQSGVFGKEFIRMYASDINEERSMEFLAIAKNVYRECSEFVHGNYEKITIKENNIEYDERFLSIYIEYFSSVKYIVSMALLIRFREILKEPQNLCNLEQIIIENLGMLPEIQRIFSEGGICNE